MTKRIDWKSHIEAFDASNMTKTGYCESVNISVHSFKSYYYKFKAEQKTKPKNPSFKTFRIGTKLSIFLEPDGSVSINGLEPHLIPNILKACSDAVS